MTISIRRAEPADLQAIARLDSVAFGFSYTERHLSELADGGIDLARFWVAVDDSRAGRPDGGPDGTIVGVTGDFDLTVTVPGLRQVRTPGVTWVSVAPTHRRQGILRGLMIQQLTDYADRGESMAMLTASEGGIYGRFGYGAASVVRTTEIDRRTVRLVRSTDPGSVRLVPVQQARDLVPALFDRWHARTVGAVSRWPARWRDIFTDHPEDREGATEAFYLVHADGYIAYRVKEEWGEGHPSSHLWIHDYVYLTPQAHLALWQVVLGYDLVGTIHSHKVPFDDPLARLLDNPRQPRTTAVNDGVWVRPLDVAAMLSARRYAVEVDAVLEIQDSLFGDGRYHLTGGPDGAHCRRVDRGADVRMPVATLGAVYLGGSRLNTLHQAGLAETSDDALLSRLDRAFLADREPTHGTPF
ncbi:GNAT family N-acetyltransferase [Jatrophihabitans telluris]|uniref:GNAT family N-acetyltransferase n=1 Tax=Jatrophihabitans telluris TaxID=2038343 RepID=A0ABY4R3J8_9ACTN|nr:GNAT family N-acetyltransferase [Jatrophihabitans telluris]UQX90037.1 GNAT family N-acetyltransferase [Jatrophihabitans telluris]